MHLTLQGGHVSLRCRNLMTDYKELNFEVISPSKKLRSLQSSEFPSEFEGGTYYEDKLHP